MSHSHSPGKVQDQLAWIAVDWGSTHLRTYALDQQNQVLAQDNSEQGMGSLRAEEYEAALLHLIQPWLPESGSTEQGALGRSGVLVLACGMVGAKQGWQEAPYRAVPCHPAVATELTAVQCTDKRLNVRIVAGLSQQAPADVMRGEETQLLGLLSCIEEPPASVCLPGTHSKWVSLQSQQVQKFQTYMTGEFYSLLSQQSLLRHNIVDGQWSDEAFEQAVVEANVQPQDLLSATFGIRARSLLRAEEAGASAARLSGWLIGCELASARDYWQEQRVGLIGATRLCQLYAKALQCMGAQALVFNPDELTLAGLQQIHRQYVAQRCGEDIV